MKIIDTPGLPIKSWCEDLETGALTQAKHIAQLPFAYHHIALMPDAHQGYGMPIGAILATKDVIVPNAVGVDIGCGMLAYKTVLQDIDPADIRKILGLIRQKVPLGFERHKNPRAMEPPPENAPIVKAQYENARHQVGTLGGGNHFIELQKGSDGHIWFMIHSGSRNLGKQVCDHYNALAKKMNASMRAKVLAQWDLAFLPTDTKEGQAYIAEMEYCQRFAAFNRRRMFEEVLEAFAQCIPGAGDYEATALINAHHNYARREEHFGQMVWVHRKGAISAQRGEVGIVPGSQGAKSYIVTGLGKAESFCSCSHGAGRKMGRKEAQRKLSLADEIRGMEAQGIVHGMRGTRDLEEAPGAYKDIAQVMAQQKDLVEVFVELRPLGVIKA